MKIMKLIHCEYLTILFNYLLYSINNDQIYKSKTLILKIIKMKAIQKIFVFIKFSLYKINTLPMVHKNYSHIQKHRSKRWVIVY